MCDSNKATQPTPSLAGLRVLCASLGVELFGHERGTIEVYKSLLRGGAQLRVGITPMDGGGPFGKELRALGIETFFLPFGPQWSWQWVKSDPSLIWRNPAAVVQCGYRLYQEMRLFRPSHVFIGNPIVFSYLAMPLLATKVIVVYRNGDAVPSDSWFNYPIWKAAMARADTIVAISEFVKRRTVARGIAESKVRVIYNCAPTARESTMDDRVLQDDGWPRILYVGNIAEHKGVLPLIEAAALLKTTWPGFRLDVLGGSRWEQGTRGKALGLVAKHGLEANVMLHGFQANPRPFYRRAHVHVAPSIWEEPLGNVVLEAKLEGIPSVVFPSGGLPEMVRDRVDGVVCTEKTPENLAEAIGWLLADRERLQRCGNAAREDSVSRFGTQRFDQQWAEAFTGP